MPSESARRLRENHTLKTSPIRPATTGQLSHSRNAETTAETKGQNDGSSPHAFHTTTADYTARARDVDPIGTNREEESATEVDRGQRRLKPVIRFRAILAVPTPLDRKVSVDGSQHVQIHPDQEITCTQFR
jgi:hypothetical protein